MEINVGDPIMHWTYGLSRVVGMEERALAGPAMLYYAVEVSHLTIWVPADDNLHNRLRRPTTKSGFKRLFAILASPGEPLPEDRQERRTHVLGLLKDGRAESLCRVIRDMVAHKLTTNLNESDQALLKRAEGVLLGEWSYSFSIPETQAEADMFHLLKAEPVAG